MAGGKGAKAGVKAAGKTASAAPKAKWKEMTPATHKFTDLGDEGKAHYTELGNKMGMDAVAAWRLETQLRPELEAAGYTPSEIKKAMGQGGDPFENLQAFVADERERLIGEILASPAGYDRTVLDSANLRDLWGTYDDVVVSGKPQPSNIRGKDPNATQTVESRTAGADTASTPAPQLAEPPKGGAAPEKPLTPKEQKKLEAAKAKEESERRMRGNAATAKEGDFGSVDWLGSNKDSGYANRTASEGDWSRLGEGDFAGRDIEPGEGAYKPLDPSTGIQPEPPKEVKQDPPVYLQKSPLIRGAKALGKNISDYRLEYGLGALGLAGARGAGMLLGSGTSATPQPQPAVNYQPIMSYEDLKRMELDRKAARSPQAAPPPPPAAVGPDKSTDLIRQMALMSRMS